MATPLPSRASSPRTPTTTDCSPSCFLLACYFCLVLPMLGVPTLVLLTRPGMKMSFTSSRKGWPLSIGQLHYETLAAAGFTAFVPRKPGGFSWPSSAFPLKDPDLHSQGETHLRTALPGGGGSHDLADIRCTRTMRRVLGFRCGTGRHQPSAALAVARLFREFRVSGWSGPRTRS